MQQLELDAVFQNRFKYMAANRRTCAPSQLHVRRLRPGAERHRARCSCVRLSPGRLVPRQLLLRFLSLEQIGMLVGGAVGSGSPFLRRAPASLCQKKKTLMNDGTKELMGAGWQGPRVWSTRCPAMLRGHRPARLTGDCSGACSKQSLLFKPKPNF